MKNNMKVFAILLLMGFAFSGCTVVRAKHKKVIVVEKHDNGKKKGLKKNNPDNVTVIVR